MLRLKIFLLNILFCFTIYSLDKEHNQLVNNAIQQNLARISAGSLNRFGKNIYSQYGEDGIIEEIFKRIGITQGFFVEFGAWDGIFLSNTRHLWENGWQGAMIEADPTRYALLKQNYSKKSGIIPINEFVSWHSKSTEGLLFDEIKKKYFNSRDIDFLSIDIDGCDFLVLKSLACRPKVICMENGLKWHPLLDKEVPEDIAKNNLHQPIQIVMDYASKIGYKVICTTINIFLVREEFSHLFNDTPTDALTLWKDAFRSFPFKQYWLDCRNHSYPQIKEFEGDFFEKIMPITLDS